MVFPLQERVLKRVRNKSPGKTLLDKPAVAPWERQKPISKHVLRRPAPAEHFAQITMVARTLGGERLLSPSEVSQVEALRGKYGLERELPQCQTCEPGLTDEQEAEPDPPAERTDERAALVDRLVQEVISRLSQP